MTLNSYLKTFRSVKRLNCAMPWNTWDISTTLFPVLHVFWRNNKASAVENTSWKPLPRNGIPKTLNFKMFLDALKPSSTYAFGARSKATYYSLAACYLKTFWQPWLGDLVWVKNNNYSISTVLFLTCFLRSHILWAAPFSVVSHKKKQKRQLLSSHDNNHI